MHTHPIVHTSEAPQPHPIHTHIHTCSIHYSLQSAEPHSHKASVHLKILLNILAVAIVVTVVVVAEVVAVMSLLVKFDLCL